MVYAAYLQFTTTSLLGWPIVFPFAFPGPGRRVMFAQQASLCDGGLFFFFNVPFSFGQPAVRSLLHLEFAYVCVCVAPKRKMPPMKKCRCYYYLRTFLPYKRGICLINGLSWGQSRSLFRSCISESASRKPNYELMQPRGPD